MEDGEWIKRVRELAESQSKLRGSTFDVVRAALVASYELMSLAGAKPSDLYAEIAEDRLAKAADDQHARLESEDWTWNLAGAGLVEAVLSVAARIRALDRLLKEIAPDHGPPVDIEREYLCEDSGWSSREGYGRSSPRSRWRSRYPGTLGKPRTLSAVPR